MKKMLKYSLDVRAGIQHLKVPYGAIFRSIHSIDDNIYAWFEVEEQVITPGYFSRAAISLVETGKPFIGHLYFLGTVILHNGSYVLHAFTDYPAVKGVVLNDKI